jgi:hypothetical protein
LRCTSVEGQVFEAAVVGHGAGRVPHLPLLHHVTEEPEEVKRRPSEGTPFRQHTTRQNTQPKTHSAAEKKEKHNRFISDHLILIIAFIVLLS